MAKRNCFSGRSYQLPKNTDIKLSFGDSLDMYSTKTLREVYIGSYVSASNISI